MITKEVLLEQIEDFSSNLSSILVNLGPAEASPAEAAPALEELILAAAEALGKIDGRFDSWVASQPFLIGWSESISDQADRTDRTCDEARTSSKSLEFRLGMAIAAAESSARDLRRISDHLSRMGGKEVSR